MNYYHPITLEYIQNPLPVVSEWALSTTLPVPVYNPQSQNCSFVNGAWIVTDSISLKDVITQKLLDLAKIRFEKETAGITINGSLVRTDRESRGTLAEAYIRVQQNPTILIDWKSESGWIQIDKNTVENICDAVGAYVQSCFSNEKNHNTAISALTTIDAVKLYDISIGWP